MPVAGVNEPKFAVVSAAADGVNEVVAAQPGKHIVVLGYALVAVGTTPVDATWRSAGNAISGALALAANGGVSYAGSIDAPAFQTAKGEALNLNMGAGDDVFGHLTYVLVG